jgi:small-conductance mechanosensitive channel
MDGLQKALIIIGKIFDVIWSYNLVTVSGNHIKVGNIVLAVALFLAGIRLSKRFTLYIKSYIKTKIDTDKDAANALEKLILYVALALYIITILEIANVPLSTFAFIGGALAIGIGLGAQTLIGNFISSLIIMVERPVKIGDIIEIEGVLGTVTSVGARCAVINTFSNVEVLIPNSKLMQNTLVNWSLSDSEVRYQLEIVFPAKYRDKYNEIAKLMKQALSELNFESPNQKIEVFLTAISPESIRVFASFYCNINIVGSHESIRGLVNLALLEKFKNYDDFAIEYPKMVEVKSSCDKEESRGAY